MHTPAAHTSEVVHWSPSSHEDVEGSWSHEPPRHTSFVQTSPSLQLDWAVAAVHSGSVQSVRHVPSAMSLLPAPSSQSSASTRTMPSPQTALRQSFRQASRLN